jgi:hypothetical protein
MTISSTTVKVSYSGNGSTTVFAYTFKILDDDEIQVIIRSSTGTETVKTKTTHYTVSGVGSSGGGNITFLTAPTASQTVVLRRLTTQTQETDYVANDPFPADSHEEALDRVTMVAQEIQEELGRAIKLSKTNTMTSTEFTVAAADRANKILAFDTNGEISVTQELGTYKGNWATATAYYGRDIIKDTSNNNIYIANTAHTSTGSQPISTNADVAKWDLLVDAASASASATAAAASAATATTQAALATTNGAAQVTLATAQVALATTQATNAATSASTATTQASNASTSATAAAASAASAAVLLDTFDDIYLGAYSTNPTLDNDGGALTAGDLYFNTVSSTLQVYSGSAWQTAAVSTAGFVTLTGAETLTNKTLTTPVISSISNTGTLTLPTSTDTLVGLATTNTLTNKTLTAPKIANGGFIADANGNEQIKFTTTASAVNELTVTNSATGNRPDLSVTGGDTNIGLSVTTKGTGLILFNDAAYNAEGTLTDGATVAWDVGSSPVAKLTLGGNRTLSAPTNGATGQFISIAVIQDATGSRTLTWNSAYEFTADTAPTLTTTVSKADLFVFRYNGTVWHEMGRNLNLSIT